MRLTVLGASGAFPGPARACSGYVVEHAGTCVVVDLGWGTLPRLFTHLGGHTGDGVDALVVTHEHPDHAADLFGLFRARWYARRGAPSIPLMAPRPVVDALVTMEGDAAAVRQVFEWEDAPGRPVEVGAVRISTVELPHHVVNAGVRIEAGDVAVAFTGDTGPSPLLAELGKEADLYVVDATDRHQQPGVAPAPAGTSQLNLTASDAGAAATASGARALLLTHHWPGNDPERSRRDAAQHYGGPVLVAADGLVVDVPVAGPPARDSRVIDHGLTDSDGRAVMLRPVDEENWRAVADVAPLDDQRDHVAALAARYLLLSMREDAWSSLVVYAGDAVVGHVMWGVDDDGSHWIGGTVVDGAEQGRGVGRAAVRTLTSWLASQAECWTIRLSYASDNIIAERLYTSLGFVPTGTEEDGEIVAELPVAPATP